jgi:hypothetical protein
MYVRPNVLAPKEHRMPYGRAPFFLGLAAVDALHDLCDVPEWTEARRGRWLQSDKFAFHGWFVIEEKTALAQAEPDIKAEQVEHINVGLFHYRVALPFDEAERRWLYDAYAEAWGPNSISVIRRKEGAIVSGGLHRVIYGRDLMRRWWAWRRETDEFRGQGTVDLAREALREIIETVSPDLGLPEPYRELRGLPKSDTTI